MPPQAIHTTGRIDRHQLLQCLVQGTARETGEDFFAALTKNLANALNTKGAWITKYIEKERRLKAISFWLKGSYVDHYEYDIEGTPCELVVDRKELYHVIDKVTDPLFLVLLQVLYGPGAC